MAADSSNAMEGVKHPLQRSWTLHYDNGARPPPGVSWLDIVKEVYSVSTAEVFWGLFNNVEPPSSLYPGYNYHFFETGVKPAWEDVRNQKGGKWTVALNNKKRPLLDKYWLNALLAIIGESFPHTEQITGVVVSIRKSHGDKISLWTSNADDEEAVLAIGKFLRESVLESDATVTYASHEESQKRQSRHTLP